MTAKTKPIEDQALIKSLLPRRASTVRQLFNEEGLRAPEIIWSPKPTELVSPMHRQFIARVAQMTDANGCIEQERFDIGHFERFSDWLIHLSIEDDGAAFRYLYYGNAVGQAAGEDMIGRTSADHGGYTEVFLTTLYRAALRTRVPVYSYHESPREMFTRGWHRMIVPIADGDGALVEFLVLAVADLELAVGLELLSDPVFVVNAQHQVAYCNKAARQFFHLPRIIPRDVTFASLTGFSLGADETPDSLMAEDRTLNFAELVKTDGLMDRLDVTVSAAEHRGKIMFIVSMRMAAT
jgi:hypothetical protein